MKHNHPEILAPAGSMETLTAALRTGADAVYVGGKRFSARSSAANFSIEELEQAVDLCHLYGAKLYLAVNTIISDDEAHEFCKYITETARIGVDAYIVQDWGCAELIRRCVPDAVLHASTQMSVHTSYGAAFLKKLGFSRVVPARELDKNTLKRICDTGIETEIFVHGALCMSVSGQCYMSAVMGSRSANRGCCGQACRLPFSAKGNKDHAALSLKDLSLIRNISELEEIGTDSLKIEGRMKRPEYVAAAVNAIRDVYDGNQPDMQLLRGIFSRGGFTNGYFTANRKDMFGVREKDDVVAAQTLIPKIHELYRYERKVRTIDFHAVVKSEEPLKITASCGNLAVEASSECPEAAKNRPTDIEFLKKQLSKLGDTVYSLGEVTAEIEDGLAISAGRINELRRTLTEKMNALIISEERPKYTINSYIPQNIKAEDVFRDSLPLRAFCRTAEQAIAAAELAEFVIIPHTLLNDSLLNGIEKSRIIVSPPRFISDEDKTFAELAVLRERGFTHLMCHTPDSIAMGKQLGFRLHGGFGLNIFNSFSAEQMNLLGLEDILFSFEAKTQQINAVSADIPIGAVLYGRLPLMLTRNCPIKNEVGCGKCTRSLTDRTGRKLPVSCSGEYVEILNPDVLYELDRTDKFASLSFGAVLLHEENAQQTINALRGIRPDCGVTHGLYQRGII